MQHTTAAADKTRAAKQQAAMQVHEWAQMYGKEGATAMQQMQQLLPMKPRKGYKVNTHTCKGYNVKVHPLQTQLAISH